MPIRVAPAVFLHVGGLDDCCGGATFYFGGLLRKKFQGSNSVRKIVTAVSSALINWLTAKTITKLIARQTAKFWFGWVLMPITGYLLSRVANFFFIRVVGQSHSHLL